MEKEIARPINDDILPEPTRTEPLKLIEPELPIENVDRTPVVFENEDLKLKLSGILFTPKATLASGRGAGGEARPARLII